MEKIVSSVMELLPVYGLRLLAALAIFVVGRWLAKRIARGVEFILRRRDTDETVVSLAGSLTYALLLVGVLLAALQKLGVEVTTFVAVIGAAALAIGLALQGSLANFASGVLLAIFRPFKVGDFVEIAGTAGVVETLQIFTTQLATPDNKTVIVPNAQVTGGTITNYSTKGTRRVDLVIGVSYEDDLAKAKQVIGEVLAADERVLKDPAPTIGVLELADSSVNLAVRPWTRVSDYWDVYFGLLEAIKVALDANDITIPFPQTDVYLHQGA